MKSIAPFVRSAHLVVSPLAFAVACAYSLAAQAEEVEFAPVLVTAPAMHAPLRVEFDPKAPQQPLPASDGASFLKTVPGMSVIRKGGTDGDPVFRGMAGSRTNILIDGENILGGCGMRMDPPTAYVFPETFDRVVLLKGPQTVLYGPGASAATVLFERDIKRFVEPGWTFDGSLTAGSFGRADAVADARTGNAQFYLRGNTTYSRSDDYQDGDGREVHSAYKRWSANAGLGWTPDDNTRIELSAIRSDGEAAYADRAMDGVKFARENVALKFDKKNITPLLTSIEAQVYYNYVDHVMDNYSLRTFSATATMPNPAVSNPDRKTVGARVMAGLQASDAFSAKVGLDAQRNEHTLRSTMNETTMPYEAMVRTEDANFRQVGLFGEGVWKFDASGRAVAGLRADRWHAQDKRAMLKLGMTSVANPTANAERDETLKSGFMRYERDYADRAGTVYAGVGHTERFPDYWELVSASKEGPTASDLSAFATTRAEKTTQLDIGTNWKQGPYSAFVSGFYSDIEDFILIQSGVSRTLGMATRTVSIVRNVDATTWGAEAGAGYAFAEHWRTDASLAWTHGDNDTDDRPLAQIPPLEARFNLAWDNGVWNAGALLRIVAGQDRFAKNQGNIVGQDIGATGGFAVFSINGGWRAKKGLLVSAGIDNLFDRTYAEHISRSGAMVTGYTQTLRVNEPGRTVWIKAQIALD